MDRKEDGSLLQNLLSSVCTVPDAEDIMSEDRTPGTGHSGRFVRGSPPCLLFSACCKAGGSLHLKPTEGFLRMVGVPRASKTGRAAPGNLKTTVLSPGKSTNTHGLFSGFPCIYCQCRHPHGLLRLFPADVHINRARPGSPDGSSRVPCPVCCFQPAETGFSLHLKPTARGIFQKDRCSEGSEDRPGSSRIYDH